MTKIIALSGRKQSGKSTGAEYIETVIKTLPINLSYRTYSFADPLKKDICMDILGLTYSQCYGSDEDKNTMTNLVWDGEQLTARRAMEVIGTDIFRKLMSDVWVEATIRKIQKEQPDIAIIPDCRFPNEVNTILKYKGYVIRLTLDPFNSSSHSESALDYNNYDWNNFSIIIDNKNMNTNIKNEHILRFLSSQQVLPL